MPVAPLRVDRSTATTDDLAAGFDAIRDELGISATFPADVLAEADEVARSGADMPGEDLRDVPFVTIDPADSLDLDQAICIVRESRGYLVRYAIADVGAFVTPGGVIDAEARRRGVTIYLPDGRVPLHPPKLSEDAASLLPVGDRRALVWHLHLDAGGEPVGDVRLARGLVRSRAKLSYSEVQAALDAGTAEEPFVLLREVGKLRQEREAQRGGVSLPLPEQRVVMADGRYRLEFRAPVAVEGWNAQISLLTGMCAAKMMIEGGVGVLRTLAAPAVEAVEMFRRRAKALRIDWPDAYGYDDMIRSLDPALPAHAALLSQAARLFRGAGYLGFRNGAPPGDGGAGVAHAAVAAPYAHVTAPLRRLVDRFGNEIAVALSSGAPPPAWATEALDSLPELMQDAGRREGAATGMALDLVEAAVLAGRVGDVVEGVVINVTKGRRLAVQIREPAVLVTVDSERAAKPGTEIRLRVVDTDLGSRRVVFDIAS